MNNENITSENTSRPFGFWLRTVDGLLAREFESAFRSEGITRRDWRILTLLAGDSLDPERAARLHRGGGKKLGALLERGWVLETEGAWTLTDDGRAAQARLAEIVTGIRSKVSGAVSDEDFATTLATLESVARELGWDGSERMPHGFGHRRGFGRGRGFGRRGFGGEHPAGPFPPRHRRCDTDAREQGGPERADHGHRGHGRGPRHTEQAFERGFTAGFAAAGSPTHSA